MNTKKYDAVHTETLKGHTSSVLCCKFSKDGSLIASGGADCTVRIWDLKAWQDSLHIMGATMAQFDDNISAMPNTYTEDEALREGHTLGSGMCFLPQIQGGVTSTMWKVMTFGLYIIKVVMKRRIACQLQVLTRKT